MKLIKSDTYFNIINQLFINKLYGIYIQKVPKIMYNNTIEKN